jgi:hypothetical protein
MTRSKALTCLTVLLALAPSLYGAQPPAPAPSFTISASNVTMSSGSTSYIPFTLTSVNGFAGTLVMGITPPSPPAGVRLPYLEIGGPARDYVLTANGTLTGSLGVLSAIPVPVPVRWNIKGHGERAIWSVAGALLLGLGLRRRRALATHLSLAVAILIGLTGMSACGGPPTLTPGIYTYTLTASENNTALSASTQVTVTVPSGIVTN